MKKKAGKRKNELSGCSCSLFESTLDQVGECVLIASRGGPLRYVNDAFLNESGLDAGDLERLVAGKAITGKPKGCLNKLVKLIAKGEPFVGTISYRAEDGETGHVKLSLSYHDDREEGSFFVVTIRDVTEMKRAEERLRKMAYSDFLTGLPNRAKFLELVEKALSNKKQKGKTSVFCILLVDLDRFKIINDGLGHSVGDELLSAMAKRLGKDLPPGNTIARLVGDQFAILLPNGSGLPAATVLAKHLESSLTRPLEAKGRSIYFTASIGIAMATPETERPEEILSDAETAMYRAKKMGGAQRVVFEKSMRSKALEAFQLESDLHRAIQHDDFRIFFQPIVSLRTGKTAAFEALVRWQHPKKGLVMPVDFITTAEQTGLIIPIGLKVFEKTCVYLQQWKKKNPKAANLTTSVNISGVQFLQPELVPQIDLLLRNKGLHPSDVKLEITESVLIEHARYADAMLKQLKAQGFNICIDDFGTGYSSMSYLKDYPIDTVKVDQSFTMRIDSDPQSLQLVKSMVAMAHNLGKEVIVEGVETTEQLSKVRAMRCEYVQGFLFSEAVDGQTAETHIAKRWYC